MAGKLQRGGGGSGKKIVLLCGSKGWQKKLSRSLLSVFPSRYIVHCEALNVSEERSDVPDKIVLDPD